MRQHLEAFAADVFAPLARSDQRAKCATYLRGLLLDGRRKSMQPMAARLGIDHQGLQQFVTTSTWDTMAVRARLAWRAVELIDPVAWVFDDTGFPKDGTGSPGVARQYSGALGKVANCQIGVSVHAVTVTASCPLDWRLFLPESWDPVKAGPAAVKQRSQAAQDVDERAPRRRVLTPTEIDVEALTAAATETARKRRRKSAIPDDEGHRPKWMLAIEMLDSLAEHGLEPPMVAADSGYGDSGPFRAALDERGIIYSVQVKGETLAQAADTQPSPPTWSGHGRPPTRPEYPDDPISIAQHAVNAGRDAATTVTWREGSKGTLTSQFVFLRVRPAGHRIPRNDNGTLPQRWLTPNGPTTNPNRSPTG